MSVFTQAVSIFMSTPVHVIPENSQARDAEERMGKLGVSSLAVVDDSERLVGVVTSTDLIHSGLRNASHRPDSTLLESSVPVSAIMTPNVISVSIDTPMTKAAERMVSENVHRVFVLSGDAIAGVLSTNDMMSAVEQQRVETPVSQVMSTPVITVRASEPILLATERLGKAHISGVIVVDDSGWPVGVYGQKEAMEVRDEKRSMTVEHAMNPAVLVLPDHCSMHQVARQALAMNARRVAVMNAHELVGVVTGTDFAKAIA